MWLAEFPLRRGEVWAWWLFVVSGVAGFGVFLAYWATVIWTPGTELRLFYCCRALFAGWRCRFGACPKATALAVPATFTKVSWRSGLDSRLCLLATAAGMISGGLTIMIVG